MADVSSVCPSSTPGQFALTKGSFSPWSIRSDEGLTLKTSAISSFHSNLIVFRCIVENSQRFFHCLVLQFERRVQQHKEELELAEKSRDEQQREAKVGG